MTAAFPGSIPAASARRRALAVAVMALAAVVSLRWIVPFGEPLTVLPLPGVGAVVPAQLADGTPVFVAHDAPGAVRVIEALAPETVSGGGIGELAAWCEEGRRFVVGHHGRSYAPNGQRYVGSTPGRLPVVDPPAPADLVSREWEVAEGQLAGGDPLRVGAAVESAEVPTELRRPQLDSAQSSLGPPASCQLPLPPLLVPPPEPDPLLGGRPPLDHSALATPLDPSLGDGWRISEGHLVIAGDGRASWCLGQPTTAPPACDDPGPMPVVLGLDDGDTGGGWAVLSGAMAMRVEDGTVVAVAPMFSTTWRGSSLRGGVGYDADLEGIDQRRSVMEVRPVDARPACVGPGRAQPGSVLPPPGIQYVDLDSLIDVRGMAADVLEAHFAVRPLVPIRVSVRADAATCRALSVVSAP